MRLAGESLHSSTVDGLEYWWSRNSSASTGSRTTASALLLPAYDEYTVGYADRSVAADRALLPTIGHGLAPNILIGGRVAGTWKRTILANGSIAVTPSLLRKLNRKEEADLNRAIKRYADFLGSQVATVEKRG